ncbi:MAG TPA: 2-oxoglutarate dehydrogenase, E2 component, dihydrolipoamide succinyltransferase [Ignavibacteriaceae bacterium]|nr:2-oxoglutarate dehydrogenase, E2 component, dihydrolipoamide succinyltransferase [Ignavibacteriaceae bacterium]
MDVVMPKMGESVSEGTIIKWHKKKGDSVKRDEIIFEISTDKVDTEIPASKDGVLTDIKVNEGETVEVGTVVAVIDEEGSSDSGSKQKTDDTEKQSEEKEKNVEKEKDKVEKDDKTDEPKTSAGGDTIEVKMPKMGESVMEGTVIKWYKKVGDPIKKDETLFEISTDKVDTEVPAPQAGTVAEIMVAEQETVEVGTTVAKLSVSGSVQKSQPKKETEPVKEEKPAAPKEEPEDMHDNFNRTSEKEEAQEQKIEKGESSRFYSPLVMNIAQKEKVSFDELENIKGTGLNGRVTKNDILSYISNKGKSPAAQPKQTESVKAAQTTESQSSSKMEAVYSSGDVTKIPMDNIRQKIMQHMVASRDTSVHVTAMIEVDMTKVHNFIQAKKEEYQRTENVKLTYMAFIANAVVKGLKEYPLMNSTIEETTIYQKKYINLGIAVAMEPNGLIVPNVKGAEQRNIIGLAKSINDLALRARTKKLSPDDISSGTFTITNYGVFGTVWGTPIINQPEVAILGVGTVTKKPVVIQVDGADTIAIRPTMALTLAHDHRLIDGMLGGKFLKFVKETLENFDSSTI